MSTYRATLAGLLALYALAVMPALAAAEECPNAAFRTGPSAHLPDCRAYELVSPVFKNEGVPYLQAYSPDGSSIEMRISAGLPGVESFAEAGIEGPEATYSTHRTASGWTTVPDDLPTDYQPWVQGAIPRGLKGNSQDGQTTIWIERGTSQPDNSLNLFERLPDRSIVEVGPGLPPSTPPGTVQETALASNIEVEGVSADASRVLFTLEGDYWPFDGTEGGRSLYEYTGTRSTTPMLVGVNQAGTLISKCGTRLGSEQNAHNAMSADGRVIFFEATCGVKTGHELYARIDNGEPDARTVDISEPSAADCKECDTEAAALTGDARFEGASEDGSKVFFSTTQPLLGGDTSTNIYEYDFDAPAGERVVRVSAAGASRAEVLSYAYPLVSEDGSHIYFLANGVLTGTPNGQGEAAEAGAENLYVFEHDAAYPQGRTEFVARLSREETEIYWGDRIANDVTPDGRFLVFTSERDLTPDDTSGPEAQVFEYDAQTGALARLSIGQDGYNHNGNVAPIFNEFHNVLNSAEIVGPEGYRYQSSSSTYWSGLTVSADGSYVFFQSPVGLTPQALNDQLIGSYVSNDDLIQIYGNNIYEYHAGRVSLISDGEDRAFHHTYAIGAAPLLQLVGTDESGHDLLFTASDQLVGQDEDSSTDLYDARVDGGFPAPAGPASCEGEGCQGQLAGAPTLLSPGSELQAGGNPPLAAPATSTVAKSKGRAKPKRCAHSKCAKAKTKKTKKVNRKRRAKS